MFEFYKIFENELIEDYSVASAYEFFSSDNEGLKRMITDCANYLRKPFDPDSKEDTITELIECYGSDMDLIDRYFELTLDKDSFLLLEFDEEDDRFHIRIWKQSIKVFAVRVRFLYNYGYNEQDLYESLFSIHFNEKDAKIWIEDKRKDWLKSWNDPKFFEKLTLEERLKYWQDIIMEYDSPDSIELNWGI